jgi:hypothetical protein
VDSTHDNLFQVPPIPATYLKTYKIAFVSETSTPMRMKMKMMTMVATSTKIVVGVKMLIIAAPVVTVM